jgi:hypothetical protein
MSCPREIRPTPIAPTRIRFEGAFCPNTLHGTIVGAAMAALALMSPRLESCILVLTQE